MRLRLICGRITELLNVGSRISHGGFVEYNLTQRLAILAANGRLRSNSVATFLDEEEYHAQPTGTAPSFTRSA